MPQAGILRQALVLSFFIFFRVHINDEITGTDRPLARLLAWLMHKNRRK